MRAATVICDAKETVYFIKAKKYDKHNKYKRFIDLC